MEIILIAAMAANHVIGRDNDIPWDIPGEQYRFKQVTMGHSLIMGRKTYDSIGRPLPGRRNIVVTRNHDFRCNGCEVVHSIDEAISSCVGETKIFIIGGEQLYRMTLERADTLILTVLDHAVKGDAFFPAFSEKTFKLESSENPKDTNSYTINTYHRVPPI